MTCNILLALAQMRVTTLIKHRASLLERRGVHVLALTSRVRPSLIGRLGVQVAIP